MTEMSLADLTASVLDAMRAAGCEPHQHQDVVFDGKIHNYRIAEHKAGSKKGWFVLYADGIPAGVFGNWKTGYVEKWISKDSKKMSAEERHQYDQQMKDAKAKRDAEAKILRQQARTKAAFLWDKGSDSVEAKHPYLAKKKIPAVGIRQLQQQLLIPMRDLFGTLHSLQMIHADGSKSNLTGGAKNGCCLVLGSSNSSETILICEGYATGVSLFIATELKTVVAFDAGNLRIIGEAARRKWPDAQIVFCADDDRRIQGNPGRTKAEEAASAVQGFFILPDFSGAETDDKKRSDFNDVHVFIGMGALKKQVADALEALKEPVKEETPPPVIESVERDIDDWEGLLLKDGSGNVMSMDANVETLLRFHPAWKGLLAYDSFSYRTMKRRNPPYEGGKTGDWDNADDVWTGIWLERNFNMRVPIKRIAPIVHATAELQTYHQVHDWLDGLETWDGIERIPRFFETFCGGVFNPYTAQTAKAFFIGSIGRIRNPGCQFDMMVIMEGTQGTKKSSLPLELFGEKWNIEINYVPGTVDFYQSLRGAWCVSFGELSVFARTDIERVKQVVTQRYDTYRCSYGNRVKSHPRQSVFIGSTNKREWANDETGMRRFFPVHCPNIDREAIKDAKNQLWAEADFIYKKAIKNREEWWIVPGAAEEQDMRFDVDAWEEKIAAWIERTNMHRFSVNQVYEESIVGFSRNAPPISRADQNRIARALTHLGWQRIRASKNGKREYGYERADA